MEHTFMKFQKLVAFFILITCTTLLGEEREWEFLDQAKFKGTLESYKDGKVRIRMADGVVREFLAGGAEAIQGSYLQRSVARIPNNPTRTKPAAGPVPLISINGANLPVGPLAKWENKGRLGGSFHAMNIPPNVSLIQGRKAVVFEHAPWLLPLEYQTMVSDFIMPEESIGGETLTVVAWLLNRGMTLDRETFFCWGSKDCGELDTPDFSYGCYDVMQWYDERISISPQRFPKLNEWHQFAFVFTPSEKDRNRLQLQLYVDGVRTAERLVKKPKPQLLADNLAILGCAWEAWWGKAWTTRPARPFTGAIAGLQVYDRALDPNEISSLTAPGGPLPVRPKLAETAGAQKPVPANGATEIQAGLEKLSWRPDPDAISQIVHFGADREAVANGKAATAKFRAHIDEAYIPIDLKIPKLEAGKTYYWRVEQIIEGKPSPAAEIWSFNTSEYDLEFDGPVSEPFPAELVQDGFYSRFIEAGGYPIISPPGNHDIHMRAGIHTLRKLLDKRPDIVRIMQSANAATHLASTEHRGWGWSQFACSSYGAGEAVLREGAIILHETGHQIHMQGAEQLYPDFRKRLGGVFGAGRRDMRWIGDYGGRNMWENLAVCATWWVNDMAQDEGDFTPREALKRNDPLTYDLVSEFFTGNRMIELHPSHGLQADTKGEVSAWKNKGGIEFFKLNSGWQFYERSTGSFAPMSSKPLLKSIGGVSAIAFEGNHGLLWDKETWNSLDGNRSWSVDAWVRRDAPATAEETLIAWGTTDGPVAKLTWGGTNEAWQMPGGISGAWKSKPAPGLWHHVAWVFQSSETNNTGELRVYVDGVLDSASRQKLQIPAAAKVLVGRDYRGALAHLRVYDYDLHPLQVEEMWRRELPQYRRDSTGSQNQVWVDLDAKILSPTHDPFVWPLYPASLNQPWLRSWVNLGTLGGKFHNDVRTPGTSRPTYGTTSGAPSLSFDGNSRLISSFTSAMPSNATIELWARANKGAPEGCILNWGGLNVSSRLLTPDAWTHIALVVSDGQVTPHVNGRALAKERLAGAAGSTRLILGGIGDGRTWTKGFLGSIASLRIHAEALPLKQIQELSRRGRIHEPFNPSPADDSRMIVMKPSALAWQLPAGISDAKADVYLGTDAAKVAAAEKGSADHLGAHVSGSLKPKLKPATCYFWRVDALASDGSVIVKGPVWSFRSTEGLLLDLQADKLTPGQFEKWANQGTAGGGFLTGTEREVSRPSVVVADGFKALDFSGRKSLVSSFTTTSALSGQGSFTVSVWAWMPTQQVLEREQTMLSWGKRPNDRAEFNWAFHETKGAFVGGPKLEFGFRGPEKPVDRMRHNAPPPGGWRHIAYTYNGSSGKLTVYTDGAKNFEEVATLGVPAGEAICLGGVRTGRLADNPFAGALREVAILGNVMSAADIARLASGVPAAKVGTGWLVHLDASALTEGPVDTWKNQGSFAGEFVLEKESATAPKVESVEGRTAVTFDGQFNVLRSSINTPEALTGDTPFTVEAWILNPKLTDLETVFSMAPSVAMPGFLHESTGRAANFNFGSARDTPREYKAGFFSSGSISRNVGWKEATEVTPTWHHVAWVYSGGYRGSFSVYVDGSLVKRNIFHTLNTIEGYPMHIGASWNTARGAGSRFSGSLASLRVYDHARDEEDIRAAASNK
jgi:hypothetical protein